MYAQAVHSDAVLACNGRVYPVHKLVLASCSEFFATMFEATKCSHPVIVLNDITAYQLEALLDYMYIGQVDVLQDELTALVKVADSLQIKGLATPEFLTSVKRKLPPAPGGKVGRPAKKKPRPFPDHPEVVLTGDSGLFINFSKIIYIFFANL